MMQQWSQVLSSNSLKSRGGMCIAWCCVDLGYSRHTHTHTHTHILTLGTHTYTHILTLGTHTHAHIHTHHVHKQCSYWSDGGHGRHEERTG